ncbi:alpha/beta hydrolase [Paenibacillus sinopodophylli]|uniref:alpha/beta hydrolase n=1 Tax=Paenibacillus sinopodophylli TaxID=1837342 RepID=UPI00110D1585|nr:alpha/beta hydrolase [Paenibacillus sinopodophylli]
MPWYTLIIGIAGLAAMLMILLTAISYYFYNLAIKRTSKAFLNENPDLVHIHTNDSSSDKDSSPAHNVQSTPIVGAGAKWVEAQNYETLRMTTHDGLVLVGYYLAAKTPTTLTVILAHGYSSQGKDMGGIARFYYEKFGYNVLLPDDRGHGSSEGDYIGFGWPDRKDYLQWIQVMLEVVGEKAQILLHGISIGGATVMMVSGEELPEQVKVIVEDCGYTSVHDQLLYQLKRIYKLPAFPILPATSLLTRLKAGYHFKEASALKQVAKNKLPMLFIHGAEDRFVPVEMVWPLYEACKADKEILIVKGAGHGMACLTDKTAYEEKVSSFVGRYMHSV